TFMPLVGISASPRGLGLKPLLAPQAMHLSYAASPSRTNVFSVTPAAGLVNEYDAGEVYGAVGYEFSNKHTGGPVVAGTSGRGTVINGGWDHRGTPRPRRSPAL